MSHVPYGYKIVNAKALPDEETAKKLQAFYAEYLRCGSMMAAAKKVGIEKTHSVLGRLLKNETYLGTEFYPRLIDDETFARVQKLRTSVAKSLGRIREKKPKEKAPESLQFTVGRVEKKYRDPYEQARYAYEQIKEVQDAR